MNLKDFRIWGLAPAWITMLITIILPIGIVVFVSFAERGPYGGFQWHFSLDAYRQILFSEDWTGKLEFNPQYIEIVFRTVWLALVATILCAVLSFPVVYFISTRSASTKAVLIYLVTLPFWVSMIVRVYAWLLILGNEGVLEKSLKMLGLVNDIDSLLFNNGAMLVGLVYSYIPLMILPVYASVEKLDKAYIEAAHDLYANRWVTLRKVILPLTAPGLMAGAILVFVPCLGAVLEPTLLGGGKYILMGNLIQTQFGTGRNWPFGSAIAIILMMLVMGALIVNARRASKRSEAAR